MSSSCILYYELCPYIQNTTSCTKMTLRQTATMRTGSQSSIISTVLLIQ